MRPKSWPARVVVAVLAVAVAVGVVQGVILFSDGAFSGDYPLSASFAVAGHGLFPDAEVVYRGVQVGRVSSVSLVQGRAQVGMQMYPNFRVPATASATIEPVNVFGADEVSLSFPAGSGARALAPGGRIRSTSVQPSLNGLFAAAVPLLRRIDTTDLSTVLSNLAQAARGEGPTIARSIDEGAKLATFLDQTLPAQITALDAFNGFAGALQPTAGSFNAISAASNRFFPTFVANRAAYAKLLSAITPFADNLSQFLSAYHPSIEQLLASGADVARLIVANQQGIGTLVRGLAVYEEKIGSAVDPAEVLPNGTEFGYFAVFITVNSLNHLICALLNPQLPGASFLAPLQQALTGAGTAINCGAPAPTAPSAASGQAAAAQPSSVSQAARNLSTDLYGLLGQPQSPTAGGGGGAGSSGGGTSGAGTSSGGSGSGSTNVLKSLLGGML